jgi:hypothetical protein
MSDFGRTAAVRVPISNDSNQPEAAVFIDGCAAEAAGWAIAANEAFWWKSRQLNVGTLNLIFR